MGNEEGIKSQIDFLVSECMQGKHVVKCRDLLQRDLPSFIKNYFISASWTLLKSQRPIIWKNNKSFDENDFTANRAKKQYIRQLVRSALFSEQQITENIISALKIRFSLIVRPNRYFFRNYKHDGRYDKKKLILDIRRFGESIPALDFYIQELDDFEVRYIDDETFSNIVQKIQNRIYSDKFQKTLLKEIDLLYDFFTFNGTFAGNIISSHFLKEFFSSRGFFDLSKMFKFGERNDGQWLKKDLVEYIKEVLAIPKEVVKIGIEKTKHFVAPKVVYKDTGYIIQREKIENQPPGPYPQIQEYLSRRDKKRFIKKIWKKDERQFLRFIEKVDKLDRWRDAKQIIDWELERHHVDFYSKEAVRLGDIVFAKYFSKGSFT